jgi:hypothetical protein
MKKALLKIKANIDKRNDHQASPEEAQNMANTFAIDVLSPARKSFLNKMAVGDFERADFQRAILLVVDAGEELVIKRLNGFDIVEDSDEADEHYSITADFEISTGQILILEANIHRNLFGDGSVVKNWSLKLDGYYNCNDILIESDCQNEINDFIIENFQNSGHYDPSINVVSEENIAQINKILGIG